MAYAQNLAPERGTSFGLGRLVGLSGLAAGGLLLAPLPLYFVHSGSPPDWNILTRVVITLVGLTVLVLYWTGFRRLAGNDDGRVAWAADATCAAGLVYVAITFVAQSLEAGTAISTATPVDPTVEGPLAPGHFLLYGAIARLLMALILGLAGYTILRAGFLPAVWGKLAYALATVQMVFVPSIYFGGDAAQFYSAVGWGTTAFAGGFLLYWILASSVVLIRQHGTTGPHG